MGCVFSCFWAPDERGNRESTAIGHGICFRCLTLTQQQLSKVDGLGDKGILKSSGNTHKQCAVLFQRGEVNDTSSSVQGTTSPSGTVTEDISISDTYRAPPRPLPYDVPRCSSLRCQHERVVSSSDKASSHVHEESDPIQGTNIDNYYAGITEKHVSEGQCKLCLSQSSLKFTSKCVSSGVTDIFLSSEEEDACPICLEEYDSENPKITLQCVHSFHLSCIYEWMERSEACPVCGKVMLFAETIG